MLNHLEPPHNHPVLLSVLAAWHAPLGASVIRNDSEPAARRNSLPSLSQSPQLEEFLKRRPSSSPRQRSLKPSLSGEEQWLRQHREDYRGQWVALSGDSLIASGHDGKRTYDAARAAGIQSPMLVYIEPVDPAPFAGW